MSLTMNYEDIIRQLETGWESDEGVDAPTQKTLDTTIDVVNRLSKQNRYFDNVVPDANGGIHLLIKMETTDCEAVIHADGDLEWIEYSNNVITYRKKL